MRNPQGYQNQNDAMNQALQQIEQTKRQYIGDGVFVSFDGWGLWLTTSDGLNDTNRIYLEPEVYRALIAFVEAKEK